MTETKRDVLNKLLAAYLEDEKRLDKLVNEPDEHIPELDFMYFKKSYDAALPDDLPVIPKAVSDAIKFYWTTYGSEKGLTDLLFDLVEPWRIGVEKVVSAIHEDIRKYYLLHSDVIARAWLYGVWRVEETGEIVKLEAKVRDEN
ncbi:hypothetical protein [Lacticaseibacillus suibinensis]|uniref:hypothetical protein n=1 Tax=Lacticaseibacillus suibinensis TaxID=2486011 RepID=UPI000F7675B8|nr:hypothetical protein [Lacticaseibacillus suibinensis]